MKLGIIKSTNAADFFAIVEPNAGVNTATFTIPLGNGDFSNGPIRVSVMMGAMVIHHATRRNGRCHSHISTFSG